MRVSLGLTCGSFLACLLASLASTAGGAPGADRAVFRATLQATVTKEWNTLVEATEDGCPVTRRSIGRRTVRLRSMRPTLVTVRFGGGRVWYAPSAVRFVRVEAIQTGTRTTRTQDPCPSRTVRDVCAKARRLLKGASFGFFRSRRNEISFRPATLPRPRTSCPGESAEVRAIRPGLKDAEGGISEAVFANPRIPGQTASASSEVTTELEGAESGTVVERVSWALTFDRPR